MRPLRPLPSLKGCAIFISTYFSTISSKSDCGILSIFSSATCRYISGANRKPPFAIFTVRISPAKSYISPNKYLWTACSVENFPAGSVSSTPLSNSSAAFFLLIRSSSRASSAESVMPSLFSSMISPHFVSSISDPTAFSPARSCNGSLPQEPQKTNLIRKPAATCHI